MVDALAADLAALPEDAWCDESELDRRRSGRQGSGRGGAFGALRTIRDVYG